MDTRPILDRVKTALFDILRPAVQGRRVYDMFAGSGSVGIEALSQGAAHCVFVDLSKAAVKTILANLERTHLLEQSEVLQRDTLRFLKGTEQVFDIIFIAPPQYKQLWVKALQTVDTKPECLAATGRIIVQIDPKEDEAVTLQTLKEIDRRRYGNTMLLFYERLPVSQPQQHHPQT